MQLLAIVVNLIYLVYVDPSRAKGANPILKIGCFCIWMVPTSDRARRNFAANCHIKSFFFLVFKEKKTTKIKQK